MLPKLQDFDYQSDQMSIKDLKKETISETQSLQIPRTKSTTRRKPKEKRRSTGIPTEVSIMNFCDTQFYCGHLHCHIRSI